MTKIIYVICILSLISITQSTEEQTEPKIESDVPVETEQENTAEIQEKKTDTVKSDADMLKEPQLDLKQMEEMNKMMKILTGMQCLVSMDKYFRSNASTLKTLQDKENPQVRMDRLVIGLYKKCKNDEGGLSNIAEMIGGKKPEESKENDIYKDFDLMGVLEDDTPELSEEEKALLEEFKEVEEEMKKYQKEAEKHAKEERKKKKKDKPKTNKKKRKKPVPKKPKSTSMNYWGLVSVAVIGGLLFFLLSNLFKEPQEQPKRRKKKQKKK